MSFGNLFAGSENYYDLLMFDFLNNAKFDSDLMELAVAPAGIHLVRALSKFKD